MFALANVGLPGTSGFPGEFLTLVGAYKVNSWVALLATTGVVLGAAYTLWLYRRVVFGKLTRAELRNIADLSPREIAIFTPLVAAVVFFGIYPEPLLEVMHASVANMIDQLEQQRAAMAGLPPLAGAVR